MKFYVAVSGFLFAALVVAHGLRIAQEGAHVLSYPDFLLSSIAAAAMSAWALMLLVRQR